MESFVIGQNGPFSFTVGQSQGQLHEQNFPGCPVCMGIRRVLPNLDPEVIGSNSGSTLNYDQVQLISQTQTIKQETTLQIIDTSEDEETHERFKPQPRNHIPDLNISSKPCANIKNCQLCEKVTKITDRKRPKRKITDPEIDNKNQNDQKNLKVSSNFIQTKLFKSTTSKNIFQILSNSEES